MSVGFVDRLKLNLQEFAANTSAHGIPRAYYSSSALRRILWMLLFISCLGAFLIQAYLITARFFRNDIIVNVEMKFERIAFPSVTVCNLNPYKNSLARLMGPVGDTLKAFDKAMAATGIDEHSRRRRRRAIVEPLETNCVCEESASGLHCFPDDQGQRGDSSDRCICYFNAVGNHAWNCAKRTRWTERVCSDCDEKSGICSHWSSPEAMKTIARADKYWPCICNDENHDDCLLQRNEQVEAAWPQASSSGQCTCLGHYCDLEANGTQHCYCIGYGSQLCAPHDQWTLSRCFDCNWKGECEQREPLALAATAALGDCLCHDRGPCFAVDRLQEKSLNESTVLRVRRSPNSSPSSEVLYDPLFGQVDSMMAVYAMCNCDAADQCTHVENVGGVETGGGTVCMCFYKKNGAIWPCYKPEHWFESRCPSCNTMGNCAYAKEGAKIACACVSVIKMCVRIDEAPANSTETEIDPEMFLSDRLIKMWEITSTPDYVLLKSEEDREQAFGLQGLTDPVAIKTKAAENLVFAVNSLNDSEKEALSYMKREFITKCSFNGKPCTIERDFSLYLDPSFGNCYTFNSNASEHMISERAGAAYGLRFQVFVNISDYLPTTEASGVRITVHDPEEQPFPDTHGYSAPTGFVSSFGIRLKHMTRLPYPYGECATEGKDKDFIYRDKTYSTEGCQRTCIQKYLVNKCTCGDPRFPSFGNYSACIQREVINAAHKTVLLGCNCRQPCSEDVYTVAYSASRWPSGPQSSSECTFGTKKLSPMQCLARYREEGAMIEVYYEQLNYESLLESEAYGLPNLLSDFGGQLGLWMGVSVITISEFLILAFDILLALCAFCCRRNVDQQQPPETGTTKEKMPINGTMEAKKAPKELRNRRRFLGFDAPPGKIEIA